MKKRIVALLLATALMTSFVGCKKSPSKTDSSEEVEIIYQYEDESGNPTTNSGADTSSGSGSGQSGTGNNPNKPNSGNTNLEGNTYLSGFPIVKNKETINIMTITRSDVGDPSNSQFTKTYSALTNMDIKYQLVEFSMAAQRKTLAFQSGNLPDVFAIGSKITDADINQYGQEGAIVEITKDMLKKYAPNVYAMYNKYPETWESVKAADGKMYSIATYANTFPYGQHFLWVRKTWLNNLGLGVPQTMDQFYDMLVKFKNSDPNKNGQADEVPYATFADSGFFFNPWGFNNVVSVSNNGKVTHMYTTDNMTRCLKYWSRVYKENLVDKKVINNYAGENAAFKTLLSSGKVGAFYYGWPSDAMDDKLLSEYEPIAWPTAGNNGDFPNTYVDVENIIDPKGYVITKACKNVPAALRFIDYLYTNDGYMLKMYGNEGGLYKKESDAKYVTTGKAFTKQSDYGPSWTLPSVSFLVSATYDQGGEILVWQKRHALDAQLEKISKSNGQKQMPNLIMNKNEIKNDKIYSTYFDGIKTKWTSFVKGQLSLDSDWTALKNEMNSKGLSKYLAYLQEYYDRGNK